MVTQSELVDRVLQHLFVLPGGAVANSEDSAFVTNAITGVMAELAELGLAYWDVSAIPDAVANGLTIMVAADCARVFAAENADRYIADRERGERLIRRVVPMGPDHDPAPQRYF